MVTVDSVSFYRPFWLCMRVLVPTFFKDSPRPVQLYVMVLHGLVTLCFPLHLVLHLVVHHPSPADLLKNLTMSLTCVACSLKHVAHLYHLPEIVEIESLIGQLDKFISSEEEHRYYQDYVHCNAKRFTRCLYISFGLVYLSVYLIFLFGVIVQILTGTWGILYPAYFPFNIEDNRGMAAVALAYQVVCILVEGIQGLGNDTYTPLTLCLLAGHLQLWAIRMAQLGFSEEKNDSNHHLLRDYIEQHKLLMRFHQLICQTISEVQLVQLGGCGATLCIIVSYVLFFVGDAIALVYYMVFFGVVCVQLFPSCYFASEVTHEVQNLPYSIFSSRWYDQSKEHRFDLLVFTEMTLRSRGRVIKAGGLIELNLNAFYATLKMAYSLFAVVVRVKGI
ncbi:LOW QUALITY PROTEIN: odorant receptor 33c [Drosophila ficusphila]|uniref:LOW QUALITY PROTEIN: odorant receptor 33c n=1 Tax=Drosophila ficusphila TaxID=30025 RepID=UPI001C897AB3|nr:LOW QUALITY PROTEIN: odorant receptor 33c [Drosophila ficusphila]